MKKYRKSIWLACCVCFFCACHSHAPLADVPVCQGAYSPTWESLGNWECPDWFKDAKFGIWAHWGPQCQAEAGDWYARNMYYEGTRQNRQHESRYGSPAEYGLKDLCHDWKAERWNPDSLVALYKSIGARYFFTLGQHHDNFDLWDSPYQEWNAVRVGPHRDIVGEWRKACLHYGLPMGVSMHGSHTWTWLEGAQRYDGNLTREDGKGTWWEGLDPQELYAQQHEHSAGWENVDSIGPQWDWGNGASLPSEAFKRKFQNRVLQCINDYQPDMLYFDDTVLPFYGCDETVGLNILSHYYNTSAAHHDGQPQVVAMGKVLGDVHKQALLWDVERGVPDGIQQEYWQTCTCIGNWHYNTSTYVEGKYKSAQQVIDMLVDVVSKNGNLLLSIPIKGDGTIDDKERKILMDIKAWMDINGESIYGTRPWLVFGEGPMAEADNPLKAQGFNERNDYSSADVRYVQKEGKVYATIMRWPEQTDFTFSALGRDAAYCPSPVQQVELLGYGPVRFHEDAKGVTVCFPDDVPACRIAPVFAFSFRK